jgi:ribosomal protein S18 acetylase RimI-like enzyme
VAVGFIQGVVVPKDNDLFDQLTHDKYLEGWIGEFYVKDKFRGQGLGKLLYEKAIAHFNNSGCVHVRLLVLNDNKNALGVYEKNGFETRGLNMIKKL